MISIDYDSQQEDNNDEMEALNSILLWDEEEPNPPASTTLPESTIIPRRNTPQHSQQAPQQQASQPQQQPPQQMYGNMMLSNNNQYFQNPSSSQQQQFLNENQLKNSGNDSSTGLRSNNNSWSATSPVNASMQASASSQGNINMANAMFMMPSQQQQQQFSYNLPSSSNASGSNNNNSNLTSAGAFFKQPQQQQQASQQNNASNPTNNQEQQSPSFRSNNQNNANLQAAAAASAFALQHFNNPQMLAAAAQAGMNPYMNPAFMNNTNQSSQPQQPQNQNFTDQQSLFFRSLQQQQFMAAAAAAAAFGGMPQQQQQQGIGQMQGNNNQQFNVPQQQQQNTVLGNNNPMLPFIQQQQQPQGNSSNPNATTSFQNQQMTTTNPSNYSQAPATIAPAPQQQQQPVQTPAIQTQKKATRKRPATSTTNSKKPKTTKTTTAIKNPIVSCESEVENENSSFLLQQMNIKAPILPHPQPSYQSDDDDVSVDSTKKQAYDSNLTPEQQKAKANRDRNREHARNTRLRKKAYLEKLKCTVDELCRERDTLVTERASSASILMEIHNRRTDVLRMFFTLRNAYERKRNAWSSVLDESCTCSMPVTPYRSFPASEVQISKCQRTIMGIDGMISDTASFHVLLNSLINRGLHPEASIQFRYTLITEDSVIAGNQYMARWEMHTTNLLALGAHSELRKSGMISCKFNSLHKITSMEIMFDVMAFMLQLKQASGKQSFFVIPNTVQTCQFYIESKKEKTGVFQEAMVMTLADRPYTIVQVNSLWEQLTGYSGEEVVGKTSCGILQSNSSISNTPHYMEFMEAVRHKRPASTCLLNYTKDGRCFEHHFHVFPLSTDSKITHYLGLTCFAKFLKNESSERSNGVNASLPAGVSL